MFSQVSFCSHGVHVTITHDVLDLTVPTLPLHQTWDLGTYPSPSSAPSLPWRGDLVTPSIGHGTWVPTPPDMGLWCLPSFPGT